MIQKLHKISGRYRLVLIGDGSFQLVRLFPYILKYNMIVDLGCAKGSQHFPDDVRKVPKSIQGFIMNKNYEITRKLRHPKYVVPDKNFEQYLFNRIKPNSVIKEIAIKIETFLRLWHYGSLAEATDGLKRYIKRKLHKGIDKNGC